MMLSTGYDGFKLVLVWGKYLFLICRKTEKTSVQFSMLNYSPSASHIKDSHWLLFNTPCRGI